MTNEIKEKLAKVYQLAKNGASEGERNAAKLALDRLMKKYNLTDIQLENLDLEIYYFKYSTELDKMLFASLVHFLCPLVFKKKNVLHLRTWNNEIKKSVKEIFIELKYLDYVTLDCAYEYFRRHMKKQWDATCGKVVNRCKTTKSKSNKRAELEPVFIMQYRIKSNLCHPDDIKQIPSSELSRKELENLNYLQNLQGGKFNSQLQNGLMLIQ